MNCDNRFIKLLTISVDKHDLLLYGFSVPTSQKPHPWKKKQDKRKLNVSSAILSLEDAEHFEQLLTGVESIPLKALTLSAPELVPRKSVLSYGENWKKPAPVSRLCRVCEFWNTQKERLIQQIQATLGSQDAALYLDIQTLLAQLKDECGVDFSQHGGRLGNYERYDNTVLSCPLEVHCVKGSEGKQIIVQKSADWSRPLVVNCAAERQERILFNQIRVLGPKEPQVEFAAPEAVGRYTVYAWDQETGELVFFKSCALCNRIILSISAGGGERVVHDSWSQSLQSAATNQSQVIHEQIETVQRRSTDRPIRIGGEDLLTAAAEEGERLLFPYRDRPCKGSFIPKNQKDGEIGSFLKIQEYLKPDSVRRAVIADPYFSIPAAAKMLSRIENMSLELSVVTSLTDTDPDTGEKKNVAEKYREFLRDNALALHEKLSICNLRRGTRPVFHDRYLIRYHVDGNIDGFLLSNSLNSMGQFYPFVIAPLEPKVCRAVAEYLDQLQDEEFQKKQPKKERISCEVLFDYRERRSTRDLPPEDPAGQAWLAPWPDMRIPTEELPAALDSVLCHWEESPEEACRTLALLGGHTHPWTAVDLAALLQRKAEGFLSLFPTMAADIESSRKRQGIGVDSREHMLWSLLTGMAKPDRVGFKRLLEYPHSVYYKGHNWLIGGYCLLLALDPNRFTTLLEETCSPVMLGCLTERMSIWPWSELLYRSLLDSQNECVRLLAVHWPVCLLDRDSLNPDAVFSLLDTLSPDDRLLQAVRLLSETAFRLRCPKPSPGCWRDIFPGLLRRITETLALCTPESRQIALYWLYDCEECSWCGLYLEIANQLEDGAIRDELLDGAVEIMRNYLTGCKYGYDVSKHIALCLDGLEMRYGAQAEREMLKRLMDWNAFENAVEPALRDYNFDCWHKNYVRACWQLDMLSAYQAKHPRAKDTAKWLGVWEKRMESMADKGHLQS